MRFRADTIYRNLLSMMYELQYDLSESVYYIPKEKIEELKVKFNDFNKYYLINQPFLTSSLIENLKNLNAELQTCFEDSCLGQTKQQNTDTITEGISQQVKSRNKLWTNYFQPIQEEIIAQMKSDLHIEDIQRKTQMNKNNITHITKYGK